MVSEINSTEQSDLTSYFFMVSEINSTEQSDLTRYFKVLYGFKDLNNYKGPNRKRDQFLKYSGSSNYCVMQFSLSSKTLCPC
jgi:hypothetical protein